MSDMCISCDMSQIHATNPCYLFQRPGTDYWFLHVAYSTTVKLFNIDDPLDDDGIANTMLYVE